MNTIIQGIVHKELNQKTQSIKEIIGIGSVNRIFEVKSEKIKEEIAVLNFLHHLDKYRWAEEYMLEEINSYAERVWDTFCKIA